MQQHFHKLAAVMLSLLCGWALGTVLGIATILILDRSYTGLGIVFVIVNALEWPFMVAGGILTAVALLYLAYRNVRPITWKHALLVGLVGVVVQSAAYTHYASSVMEWVMSILSILPNIFGILLLPFWQRKLVKYAPPSCAPTARSSEDES